MAPKYKSVYLSARHMRSPELNEAKLELEKAGIEVTARWLTDLRGGDDDPHRIARISREDIERAEAYVLLGDERGDSGHRHVEFGIAMGLNKPIVVVASQWENLWQRLPSVTVVGNWEAAKKVLLGEPQA
jgi:hypothetical protein